MTTEDPSIDDVRALESFVAGAGDSRLLLTFQGILRSHERMFHALSSPPADDVREALEKLIDLNDPRGLARPVSAVNAILAAFEVRPYGTVTDPTDDMHANNARELLSEARELVASWDLRGSWTSESPIGLVARLADALDAASEVEPRHRHCGACVRGQHAACDGENIYWGDCECPHDDEASVEAAARAMFEDPLTAPDVCTCPSGDGSLRWPCPVHPPAEVRPYGTVTETEVLRAKASALTEFADAVRMPFTIFRGDDEAPVTPGDLMRETAARYLAEADEIEARS